MAEKILVVEDEPAIVTMLKYNLEKKVMRFWSLKTGKKRLP